MIHDESPAGRSGENNPATPQQQPGLIRIDEFAKMLGVSTRHVRRLVDAGKSPQPVRLGRSLRWPFPGVNRWIADGCPTVRRMKGGAR
jgi:excisionase family DNA binding protein